MIRIGGYTTGTTNVLEGTRFQQITEPVYLIIRAKGIANDTAFSGTLSTRIRIGSIELSNQVLNQQADTLQQAASGGTAMQGTVGLMDSDMVWSGWVRSGTLLIEFPQATSTRPILWDVTATNITE